MKRGPGVTTFSVLYFFLIQKEDGEMTHLWNETTILKTISSYYVSYDIYSVDGFGLLYQALIVIILHLKYEKRSGGKHSKIRSTDMVTASTNEKFPMFIIGKTKKSSFFKDIKKLP